MNELVLQKTHHAERPSGQCEIVSGGRVKPFAKAMAEAIALKKNPGSAGFEPELQHAVVLLLIQTYPLWIMQWHYCSIVEQGLGMQGRMLRNLSQRKSNLWCCPAHLQSPDSIYHSGVQHQALYMVSLSQEK